MSSKEYRDMMRKERKKEEGEGTGKRLGRDREDESILKPNCSSFFRFGRSFPLFQLIVGTHRLIAIPLVFSGISGRRSNRIVHWLWVGFWEWYFGFWILDFGVFDL